MLFFYGVLAAYRSWNLLYRKTGIRTLKLKQDASAQGVQARTFSFVTAMALLASALYSFGGAWHTYLAPIQWLESSIF
ncbi:MAG: hypothetical protein AAF587_04280 [Bacteroidota bacterium]